MVFGSVLLHGGFHIPMIPTDFGRNTETGCYHSPEKMADRDPRVQVGQ